MKKILIVVFAVLCAGVPLVMSLGCFEDESDDPKVTRCESYGGFCSAGNKGCGEKNAAWTPWECPDPLPDGDFGMCCVPINSCADLGGVCKLQTESCPTGTGGTVYMDCPQGNKGQCCISF